MTIRRRGKVLEAAIFSAVKTILSEEGYTSLSFEAVADKAETSKSVIYRRWPNVAQLVIAALLADKEQERISLPDTGTLSGDIKAILNELYEKYSHRRGILLGLLSDLAPQDLRELRSLLFEVGNDVFTPALLRARLRGEITAKPLCPRVLALPLDLLRHDMLLGVNVGQEDIDEIVDECFIPLLHAKN